MRESFYSVAGCPARIALVTDLHERPCRAVLASLERNRPELICAAGDFLYGRPPKRGALKVREAGVLPFFSACAALAPCFVSLGNHEWMTTREDIRALNDTGARVLDNSWTTLVIQGTRLVVGGLSSARVSENQALVRKGCTPSEANALIRAGKGKLTPRTDWLDAFCAEEGCHILLCHQPEYYPRWLKKREIELILSGHAHGGQVRIFGRGLFAPGQGLFPELTEGVVDGRLVISRGLANCQRVPRLFNPTEIVYIDPKN